ncbi:MAG: hypothetical protein ABI835_03860 [Chloroflexota bacterium]
MLRRLIPIFVLLVAAVSVYAQSDAAQPGDPPLLDHISVSPPEDGRVTVEGSAGAVFPNAYVTVRNMFTGATVTAHAGITGNFSTRIAASGSTPFWISPSEEPPTAAQLAAPGSLPGGPGVIVYGVLANTPERPTTQIAIDGALDDWNAYPDSARFSTDTRTAYAIRNADSLYVAFSGTYVTTAYAKVEVHFTVDISTYTVTLDPRQAQAADLVRINPVAANLGTLIVAGRQAGALELRIPLTFVDRADRVSLDAVRWLNASGGEIGTDTISTEIPLLDESDGVFHSQSAADAVHSNFDGVLANGAIYSVDFVTDPPLLMPGDEWRVTLDVNFASADLPANALMIGQIALQPVALRGDDGVARVVGGISTQNGWSSSLTMGGLPVDNLRSDLLLGEATALPFQLVRGETSTRFPLEFTLTVPDDLAPGLYVPFFTGYTQNGAGERTRWEQPDALPARLPLVVNVGSVTRARLLWTLFADDPSDGSRGLLPDEDQPYAALSNRVRFNSPTTILPPFAPGTREPIRYPLEPYLLNQLANSDAQLRSPLIPFLFPNGEISLRITRPDGTVNNLGSAPILQNQLASAGDQRDRFGRQSPLNEYRLTTLNPTFGARSFDQYGEYTISLTGSIEDAWGNRYQGGGTYRFLSAELLDLTPGVMSGTPFAVGDALNFGLHLAPGVPAEVTVTVWAYPLDGSDAIEQRVSGRANARGYFQPDDAPFIFETSGEYVIDYEARYTDANGRLWAASLRGAGVIAGENSTLVAHGERGVPGINETRPTWFSLPQITEATGIEFASTRLSLPYHSGDVLWIPDGDDRFLAPVIRVQELYAQNEGDYANWLIAALPDAVSANGLPLRQSASEGELPVLTLDDSTSTTYVSAVRPNVSVRQFIAGSDAGGLSLEWDGDDPLNQQIGAGVRGSESDDFIFLFGGAVVRTESVRESAIYAALAVIGDDEKPRVSPPDRGAAGSADGGTLLTIKGQNYDAFINLTGVQPGEVLSVGDTVTVAGQVAPTLDAAVMTTFTAPSGRLIEFTGRANPVGAYYDPAARFAVDEPGIWTVDVRVVVDSVTSAGQLTPPFPQGGVLGAESGRFSIYVLPRNSAPLDWNPVLKDTIIPIVSPYNFSFTLPEDWTEIEAFYTLTTPGYVIEDGALRVSGRSFSYSYNAPSQNLAFPNLENDGRSGTFRADVRTLTFVATGVDASGDAQIRSRTFTLMHDHLITLES